MRHTAQFVSDFQRGTDPIRSLFYACQTESLAYGVLASEEFKGRISLDGDRIKPDKIIDGDSGEGPVDPAFRMSHGCALNAGQHARIDAIDNCVTLLTDQPRETRTDPAVALLPGQRFDPTATTSTPPAPRTPTIPARKVSDLPRWSSLSITDPLTGALNRRGFMRRMQAICNSGPIAPLSVAIFDPDHFKRVNDTLGHACGDEVLAGFVQRVRQVVRSTDVWGRWGGEEFVLLMPETNSHDALPMAHRVRRAIASAPLALSCRR